MEFVAPMTSRQSSRGGGAALVACTALALITACSRFGGGSDTVGQAGDVAVDAAEVRAVVAALPEADRRALLADKAALERVVRAELLRRAILKQAHEANFDTAVETLPALDRARDDALLRLWLQKQSEVAKEYPSEQDLETAYAANTAALTPPAQYRIAQVFISAPNGAPPERLEAALRKSHEVAARLEGGDFAVLAREYSEHAASAARGGEIAMLAADQMLPEVSAAVRDLGVGAAVGPVKTSQGLHYLKLLERKVMPAPTLAQAREALTSALRAQRARQLEQAYLASLEAKLNVAVDQIALAQLEAKAR